MQWYDILQVKVKHRIEGAIQACRDCIMTVTISQQSSVPSTPRCALPLIPISCPFATPLKIPQTPHSSTPKSTVSTTPAKASELQLIPSMCALILVQRCPACFGSTLFGWPTEGLQAGDIHMATDGNLHHCHQWSGGDSPPFYDPEYFLPKHQVDTMGTHVVKERKKMHTTSLYVICPWWSYWRLRVVLWSCWWQEAENVHGKLWWHQPYGADMPARYPTFLHKCGHPRRAAEVHTSTDCPFVFALKRQLSFSMMLAVF